MASGAGLNRVGTLGGIPLLTIDHTAAAVTTPLAGYGTIGVNDSGPVMWEAIAYSKWTVQLIGAGAIAAGYSVSIYGTIDPALQKYLMGGQQDPNAPQYWTPPPGDYSPATLATEVPASSWSLLPGQAATGGVEANPLVSGTNTLAFFSGGLVAIRAVLTTHGSPSSNLQVLGFAIP